MKETNNKKVVYHYENKGNNNPKGKKNYDNEFASEFDVENRPLQLEVEQIRKYTKTNSNSKNKNRKNDC